MPESHCATEDDLPIPFQSHYGQPRRDLLERYTELLCDLREPFLCALCVEAL